MLVLSEVIEQVAARMRFVISPKGFDSDLAGYEDFGDFGFLWKNGRLFNGQLGEVFKFIIPENLL